MNEQFGPIYYQLPSDIENPYNATYKRLYESLVDGFFYLRHHDGTDELFATGVSPAFTVHSLYQDLNTVGNIGAGEDILYSNVILANKLFANGDEVKAQYSIGITNTLNSKVIRLYFAGVKIFESINDYSTGQQFDLDFNVSIIKVNATDAKTIVSYFANGVTESQISLLTPVNFAVNQNIVLTGEAVADGDILAQFAKGIFIPSSI